MIRIQSNFWRRMALFAAFLSILPATSSGQSIEVDPVDQIEAVFGKEEAVVKIVEVLKFRFRPFMDGVLKEKVDKLRFGVPYVIEATFESDPGEDRLEVSLDWATEEFSLDEFDMVRVSEGEKTFYRAVKMIILEHREAEL